jgi:hypothetical protein
LGEIESLLSIFPIVDESGLDRPIVQMMFVIYRGDWQLRMRLLKIAPSFRGSSVKSLSVQGCREKAESSYLGRTAYWVAT